MNEHPIESGTNETAAGESVRYSPLGFSFVSLVIIFILYQLVGGGLSLIITGGNFTPENVNTARAITMAAQFLFLLLPTLWLMNRQHRSIASIISWKMPGLTETVLAVIGMVALLQAAEGYTYFQDLIPIPEAIRPFIDKIKEVIDQAYRILVSTSSVGELIWVVAVVAITPAICEEILFRGLIQKNMSLATNPRRGFILTGIIFGLYHFNPFLAVPLIALGVYFSFLRYRSQTIILPMIAHFINNGISTVSVYAYGYDASDVPSFIGASQSMMSVLSSTAMFLFVFIITMVLYVKATERRSAAHSEPPTISGGTME